MYTFFKRIYQLWIECGQYAELNIEDVKDEIFDMAQPRDPLAIRLNDLLVCPQPKLARGAGFLHKIAHNFCMGILCLCFLVLRWLIVLPWWLIKIYAWSVTFPGVSGVN